MGALLSGLTTWRVCVDKGWCEMYRHYAHSNIYEKFAVWDSFYSVLLFCSIILFDFLPFFGSKSFSLSFVFLSESPLLNLSDFPLPWPVHCSSITSRDRHWGSGSRSTCGRGSPLSVGLAISSAARLPLLAQTDPPLTEDRTWTGPLDGWDGAGRDR